MTKDVPIEQFYEAVGKASSAWVSVEDAMLDVFSRLVLISIAGTALSPKPEGHWVIGNIFYASTNLRGRLDMIGQIIDRLVADEDLKLQWKTVDNKISLLYKRRNVLAHGAVWANESGASIIMGSIFSSQRRSLDYAQTCACALSFRKLADRISAYAVAVNASLT